MLSRPGLKSTNVSLQAFGRGLGVVCGQTVENDRLIKEDRLKAPELANISPERAPPGQISVAAIINRSNKYSFGLEEANDNNAPVVKVDRSAKVEGGLKRHKPTLAEAIDELIDRAKTEAPEVVPALVSASRLVRGEVTRPPEPPDHLSEAELAEFRAYAKANPWGAKHRFNPSDFISHHYRKWLGKRDAAGKWIGSALWREDIVAVEPKLAAAYATEVGRHPGRAVAGLYVRPHKLAVDMPRSLSMMRASELTEEELEVRRARIRIAVRRSRQRRASTGPKS